MSEKIKIKNGSTFAEQDYKDFMKGRIVTDEELMYLKDQSDLLGFRLEKSLKVKKKKDENENEIFHYIGFKQTEIGQLGEMMLAIRHFYNDDLSLECIRFDKAGHTHVLNAVQVNQAQTYLANAWNASESLTAPQKIAAYIQNRWGDTNFTLNRYNQLVMSYLRDSYLCIDPFMTAVEIRANEIKNKKVKPVEFEEWYKELSLNITDGTCEPYREKALKLLLKAPLIIRNENYKGQGIQNMIILVGNQGVGKSTLCRVLALGYKDEIEDVSSTDQSTAMKRETNVILENAELSSLSKAEIEKVKSAITRREIRILMKYQNIETPFKCNALLIGTSNDYDFLKDMTGERRFLPIRLEGWNNGVVTEDWVLSAYATAYLNLFDQNYNDIVKELKELDSDISKTQSKLMRARSADQDEIRNTLNGFIESRDEMLRIMAEDTWSLNVEETNEDLEFKKDNFGQGDPVLSEIKKAIAIALNNRETEISEKILQGFAIIKNQSFVVFKTKKVLDAEIKKYIEDNNINIKIYTNKTSNWLLSNGGRNERAYVNGKRVRGVVISQEKLNNLLKED